MKFVLISFSLLFSTLSLGSSQVSYQEHVQLKKTVFLEEILINDLIRLHDHLNFDGERMLAGEFAKKPAKKSYLDNLRSKLSGGPTFSRL